MSAYLVSIYRFFSFRKHAQSSGTERAEKEEKKSKKEKALFNTIVFFQTKSRLQKKSQRKINRKFAFKGQYFHNKIPFLRSEKPHLYVGFTVLIYS